MATALQGLSSLGALLHVGGSLLIVLGQTVVKIAHCIKETSGQPHTWGVPRGLNPKPKWCVVCARARVRVVREGRGGSVLAAQLAWKPGRFLALESLQLMRARSARS